MRLQLETQLRAAIREAVNRGSRKPFLWGGLKGYEQLESIAQALSLVPEDAREGMQAFLDHRKIDF